MATGTNQLKTGPHHHLLRRYLSERHTAQAPRVPDSPISSHSGCTAFQVRKM